MQELTELRKKIDQIDSEIAKLLKERAATVLNIKGIKDKNAIKTIDPNREAEILAKLDSEYEKNIFKQIITESRRIQE